MKSARVLKTLAALIGFVGLSLSTVSAGGAEKGYAAELAEKSVRAASAASPTITESEPNDTCPGQPVLCGDVIGADLSPAGDLDYFTFSANAGECLSILTNRIQGQNVDTDTRIELLNGDCSTLLAVDDDSGPGIFSWVPNFTAPHSGTYVIRVRHLSDTGTGPYELTISCNPEAPPNSTCAGAIPIPCGGFTAAGTTFCAGNDLDLPSGPGSCTGFSASGEDVVYSMTVSSGSVLTADYMSDGDGSIYVLDNCGAADSCLAGSDVFLGGSQETLTYTFPADGTYYLVLDTFGIGSAGQFTLSVSLDCQGVPVTTSTWGSIKARLYRE